MPIFDIANLVLSGIKEMRAAGMSDRSIAKVAGVSHVTILKWSSGETSPTTKNAQKFLDRLPQYLGVARMARSLANQPEESFSQKDIEEHMPALADALKVLKRRDARSRKLLNEIAYLLEENTEEVWEDAGGKIGRATN